MDIKKIAIALGLAGTMVASFWYFKDTTTTQDMNVFLQTLETKEAQFNAEIPEDRVYAQFDKPMYAIGDAVWFTAYVRDAKTLKPSTKTEILHVELINPAGAVEKEYQLIARDGIAKGDFQIPTNAKGGLYTAKIYSEWQKNDPNPAIFTKEIKVQNVVLPRLKMKVDFVREGYGAGDMVLADLKLQSNSNQPLAHQKFDYVVNVEGREHVRMSGATDANGKAVIDFNMPNALASNDATVNVLVPYNGSTESTMKLVPVVLSDIDLKFFPEGGDMVAGLSTKVAFKALDKYGKATDIEGIVKDSRGKQVATLSSFHKGMGAFDLNPKSGETYTVELNQPSGVTKTYTLPTVARNGFALGVKEVSKDRLNLNIQSTQSEEISLVASVRGESHFKTKINTKKGSNNINIDLKDFPIGVTQLTLFDSKGVARCERMAFVNQHRQLNIDIETNKEKYLPREKVDVIIKVTDENGQPVAGDFSMAVVDDQLLSYADDKSSTILSWMLMEADINSEVEDPAFYFDKEEKDATAALDYLLMTEGWRRFTWKEVMADNMPKLKHLGERAQVEGILVDEKGKPIDEARISLQTATGDIVEIKPNEKGAFSFEDLALDIENEPVILTLKSPGKHLQTQEIASYGVYEYRMYSRMKGEDKLFAEGTDGSIQARRLGFERAPRVQNRPTEQVQEASEFFAVTTFQAAGPAAANKAVRQNPTAENEMSDIEEEIGANTEMWEIQDSRVAQGQHGTVAPTIAYYRAREFAAPTYKSSQNLDKRTDFRSTVHWDGHIKVDETGTAKVSFYNSDAVSSFNVNIEGFGTNTHVGQGETKFFTQMPFNMDAKIPSELVAGDEVRIPVQLTNNTNKTLTGKLKIDVPAGLEKVGNTPKVVSISANNTEVIYLTYKVKDADDIQNFEVLFESKAFKDEIAQTMTIIPKGFPVIASFGDKKAEGNYEVQIDDLVDGSMEATLTAYPSTLGEIIDGMESMLREPNGCFEQTMSTAYPNLLAMQYMQETGQMNPEIMARAQKYIATGVKKIDRHRSSDGGFGYYGAKSHVGLTAYGLMFFKESKELNNDVKQSLVDNTAQWVLAKRDGNGGYLNGSNNDLARYGLTEKAVTDAYVTYALTMAGYSDEIKTELEAAYKAALKSDNAYQVALAANAAFNVGDKKEGAQLVASLKELKGQTKGTSAVGSRGQSMNVETTALTLMAMLQDKNVNRLEAKKLADKLHENRSRGRFGATQSTVMALRALKDFTKYHKMTDEGGSFTITVDGKAVSTGTYAKGEYEPVVVRGIEKHLTAGNHNIGIQYADGVKHPLPYNLNVKWNTVQPHSSTACPIALTVELAEDKVKVGETVRMNIKVENTTAKGQSTPMAIVGIPAGLTPSMEQLRKVVEETNVAYFELAGSNVIFYYNSLAPNAVDNIGLDLKAEVAGTYEAPASSAYLYYEDENKTWTKMDKVTVMK